MTTTKSYGSWNRANAFTLTVEQAVEGALNGQYTPAQTEAITASYRAAINAALPDGVELCGNEFYGPAYPTEGQFDGYPIDETGSLNLHAIVGGVNFWKLLAEVEQ